MDFSSYDDILKELHKQIHARLERREITELRFAKVGTACEVLHPAILNHLYLSVVPQSISTEEYFGPGITAEILVSRTAERQLHDFFAALIYARCSITAARNSITNLLISPPSGWPRYPDAGRTAGQLPADRSQLQQILGVDNDPDINSFIDTQPCFCPVILLQGEDVQVPEGGRQRLPYLSDEKLLGEGAYGEVYSVEIAAGHLKDNHSSMVNNKPRLIARKDFKKSDSFQKEYDNMKRILYTTRKCENILETLGSLQLGGNTFSLFMPLAECDLGKWMKTNAPPTDDSKKAEFLQCASGLADGLQFLHSEIRDQDHKLMVCYHMDLKPANILVFRDERDHNKLILKISDFGMSRVKIPRHNDYRDISNAFQKREEMTMSGTVNRRAEGTYLAPESTNDLRKMNEKSDVWSLGCVVSVMILYMYEGQKGIDAYSDERSGHSKLHGAGGGDFFFIRHANFTKTKLHPAVRACHKRLIKQAKQRNSIEEKAVEDILKHLEEKILQLDPSQRESAKSISDKLLKASGDYQRLSEKMDSDDETGPSNRIGKMLAPLKRVVSRRNNLEETHIKSWRLADTRTFTGCSISHSGVVIAYWTRDWINLYNAQSFLPYKGRENNTVAQYKLEVPGEWKSVRLTERYLIASTIGSEPHLYLFDLDRYDRSGPSFDKKYEIALPTSNQNGVHQIAISPGSKMIACVAPQGENKSWVCYADIRSLLRDGSQRAKSSTTLSSSDELQHKTTSLWSQFSVEAPERNVTHLLFPSDDYLCAVAQPDIDRQHNVRVSCLSLLSKEVVSLPIENPLNSRPQVSVPMISWKGCGTSLTKGAKDFDSGNSGGLFTTLAVLDNKPTLAIVLYGNQLLIRSFRITDDYTVNKNTTLQNYSIAELLVDKQRSRLFAFGRKIGRHMMLLLELPITRSGRIEKPREIKELPDLRYGDKFAARLLSNEDIPPIQGSGGLGVMNQDGVIIISSYANSCTTIYWINLPNPR